uniref:Ubiquitin-like protease family profile domain-containing protein n=1 Tax=Lactuca sativa TaxID=4236 RepID=A0A9R1VGC5_LACSA|nr:hypothetical protein LSAT_V11C500266130 [Lactuca sativa]
MIRRCNNYRTVNHFDDHVFDDNDRPRLRNPSKYRCTPYTELHTTLNQKRRPKKKVDVKSTTPIPPPTFVVVHDFLVLRLQPYVAGGEVVLQNKFFMHITWSTICIIRALFGHTHNGWLDETHMTIWIRLLMERRFDSDRYTIMSPNFFVCHVLEDGFDWRAFMSGIATYPNFMVPWWNVLMPIHSFHNHWLFGKLRLESMEVHIYDSLGRSTYKKFEYDGTLSKFAARAQRNIPRIPLDMKFIFETNVPQKSSELGEIALFLFVCLWNN